MPTLYADNCSNYGINVSGGYTVCLGSKMSSNNAIPNQTATILTDLLHYAKTAVAGGLLIGNFLFWAWIWHIGAESYSKTHIPMGK